MARGLAHDKGYYHSYCGAKAERNLSAIPDALSRSRGALSERYGCSLAVGEGSVDEYARVAVARDVGSGSKPDH